jgi:hypothetical protein
MDAIERKTWVAQPEGLGAEGTRSRTIIVASPRPAAIFVQCFTSLPSEYIRPGWGGALIARGGSPWLAAPCERKAPEGRSYVAAQSSAAPSGLLVHKRDSYQGFPPLAIDDGPGAKQHFVKLKRITQ